MLRLIKDKLYNDKSRCLIVFISVFCSYMFAHGFRMCNTMFSGDSLLMIYQNDYAWQISLGRCFQPIWLFIRGSLASPWMIIILSLLWFTLSVYFVADLLDIISPASLIILSGIMTTSTAITYTNATFVPWSDFFALALCLSCMGIWLINKRKPLCCAAGIIFLSLSLGTYQAYISVALTLVIILIWKALYQEAKISVILKASISYMISFLIAGAVYYATWKIFQKAFHIWTSNGYNGLADIGDYSSSSIGYLIFLTYKQVIYYFWNPDVFVSLYFKGQSLSIVWTYILRLSNILILTYIIAGTVISHKKNKLMGINLILNILLIAILPVGINIINIISKGMVHGLMNYSYCMVYVLAIIILNNMKNDKKIACLSSYIITLTLIAVCWVSSVYANQVYLKKQLQEEAARAEMSRIVADIEKMDDYQPGITKVSFIGSFGNSSEVTSPDGFQDIIGYGIADTSLFYHGTEEAMILLELGLDMNIINIKDEAGYDDTVEEAIHDMPNYPSSDSIKYINDIIVVKISE